ncbi:hypothetical protein EPUL_004400, partial [Erysiphe pulchra]
MLEPRLYAYLNPTRTHHMQPSRKSTGYHKATS